MAFKPYRGPDRYHVRHHRKARHFAIITEDDGSDLHGYHVTSSKKHVMKHPSRYHRLEKSITGKCCDTYLDMMRVTGRRNEFSKPYGNSHVSKKDEKYIDRLESRFKKRHK